MPSYYVVGPAYEYVEPILDDGSGPTEIAHDVVEVEADNAQDARVLGVKLLKKEPMLRGWSDENPFKGVKVYPKETDHD